MCCLEKEVLCLIQVAKYEVRCCVVLQHGAKSIVSLNDGIYWFSHCWHIAIHIFSPNCKCDQWKYFWRKMLWIFLIQKKCCLKNINCIINFIPLADRRYCMGNEFNESHATPGTRQTRAPINTSPQGKPSFGVHNSTGRRHLHASSE